VWPNNANPYAPLLYDNPNVIGYTGVLGANPTAYYFLPTTQGADVAVLPTTGAGSFEGRGIYGHITQLHNNVHNIGRSLAKYGDYRIRNAADHKAKEYVIRNGIYVEFHASRNAFIPANSADNPDDVTNLTTAILAGTFPTLKQREAAWVSNVAR